MDDVTKIVPGYPCHRYIARNLKTRADIMLFARQFLKCVVDNRLADYELAFTMLGTILLEVPTEYISEIPNFEDYGLDFTVRYNSIVEDIAVVKKPAAPCGTYYKRYDRKTACCSICPLNELNLNSDEGIELSAMKFLIASKENLDHFFQYVDGGFFRSVVDIALGIPSEVAYCVPVLKELATSALRPNVRMQLFDEDSFKRTVLNESYSCFDYLFDDMILRIIKNYKISPKIKDNPNWQSVFKQYIKNKIDNANDIDKDSLTDILNNYLAMGVEGVSLAKAEVPVQASMFDMITLAPSKPRPKTSNGGVKEKSSISDSFIVDVIDIAESIDECFDTGGVETSVSDSENISEESTLSATAPASDDVKAISESSEPVSENISDEETKSESTSPNDVKAETPTVVTGPDKDIDISSADVSIRHVTDMIVHSSVKEQDLKKHTVFIDKNKSLPQKAHEGILSDKLMPIEVVSVVTRTSSYYAYMIYSRHTKNFYIVKSDEVPATIQTLISRQMVCKVCHTPFYLYGVCKINEQQIRNVFSLQTMHKRATGINDVMSYSSLIESYENRPGVLSKVVPEQKSLCIFFYGMPSYKGICFVLNNMLNEINNPLLIDIDRNVDESVGSSFFYSRNFDDNGTLLQLMPNGKFIYKEEFKNVPLKKGKLVNYVINDSVEAYNFFRYILYALSRDGHTRKLNIQLIGWKKNYISFYSDDYCSDYFTTVLNLYIYEYGTLFPSRKIVVKQLVRDAIPAAG